MVFARGRLEAPVDVPAVEFLRTLLDVALVTLSLRALLDFIDGVLVRCSFC